MMLLLVFGLLLVAISFGMLWLRDRTQHKLGLLDRAVPARAASIRNALPGELVALSGTSRGSQELTSEHSKTPCVYYKATITREYEVRRTSRRGSRSRRSETLHSAERSIPFTVEDDSGRAGVLPEGAEFDAVESLNRYDPAEGSEGGLSIGGIDISIGTRNRTLGHRYVEHTIPADRQVLVIGVVDENGIIRHSNSGGDNSGFLISYRDPESLKSHFNSKSRQYTYSAIGAGAVGIALLVIGLMNTVF